MNNQEQTALRTLKGLRYKFARERKSLQRYSPLELCTLMDSLIKKIENNQTVNLVEVPKHPNEVWDKIDEQIERSKIKRYPWKKIIGRSLTQEILNYKKKGYGMQQTLFRLLNDTRIITFASDNPREKKEMEKNLEISVHARYGENNTAIKVMESEE